MKPAVAACCIAAGLGILQAASGSLAAEPATACPAETTTSRPDESIGLEPDGGPKAWLVIRDGRVTGPGKLDASQSSQNDLDGALHELKAGEPAMVLVASQIMLMCDGKKMQIAASDCKLWMSGKRGTLQGKAATVRIDADASRMSLRDAEIRTGLSVPGPDLDRAAAISAKSIDINFDAFKLRAEGAATCLDLSAPDQPADAPERDAP